MILLDTNILSELMRPVPLAQVVEWLNNQAAEKLFISSITVAEISYGIQALPSGKRRTALRQQFQGFIQQAFDSRILAFDTEAALLYGELMAKRRQVGHPMSMTDGQIAAVALQHQYALATRNLKDFSGLSLKLINPFV